MTTKPRGRGGNSLSGRTTKKLTFFAASLTVDHVPLVKSLVEEDPPDGGEEGVDGPVHDQEQARLQPKIIQ